MAKKRAKKKSAKRTAVRGKQKNKKNKKNKKKSTGRKSGNSNWGKETSSSERLAIKAALTVTRDDIAAEMLENKYDHLKNPNQRAFLKAFGVTGTIRAASTCVGITRQIVGHWRRNDPVFVKEFENAKEDGADILEETAMRRAMEGVSTWRAGKDGVRYKEVKYSDALLMFLLKAMRPEKYRDRYDVTTGGDQLKFEEIRNEFNILVDTPEAATMMDALALKLQAKFVESSATRLPTAKKRLRRDTDNGNGNGNGKSH